MDHAVGWLIIPVLAISLPIYAIGMAGGTWDMSPVNDEIVRLDGLSWGRYDGGRTALAAHSYGAFYNLDQLQLGNQVWFIPYGKPGRITQVWRIDVVNVNDVGLVAAPKGTVTIHENEWELLLITCYGDQRLIVRAR